MYVCTTLIGLKGLFCLTITIIENPSIGQFELLTYLSDGPTKEIKIDNNIIYFKHIRSKEMYADSLVSGLVVQALRYFGKDRVGDEIIAHLKQKLSSKKPEVPWQYFCVFQP